MSLTKNECKNYSRYKRDGRLTKYYGHPLLRYITHGQIILFFLIKNDSYKAIDLLFPLVKQCPKSVLHILNILKEAEKNKLNIIKKIYDNNTFGLCFHRKKNEKLADWDRLKMSALTTVRLYLNPWIRRITGGVV